MAIRTSSQAGNASSSSTWGGSALSSGDQCVIGHAVTFDASTTLGFSPPTRPITVPALSSVAGGGSLPGGTYIVTYTNYDANGLESSKSAAVSLALTGGNTLRVTLPSLPTGITSRRVYLTAAGGASGTETLYATGVTATTKDCTSASWTDGTTTQVAAASTPNASAIVLNTAGSVVVNTGVTLTCKGDIERNNTSFQLNGTAIIEFDSSANVAPTTCRYYFFNGMAGSQTSGILKTSGTSLSAMATIRSNASGTPAMIRTWVDQFGILVGGTSSYNLQFVNFSKIGDASNLAGNHSAAATQILNNCLFDNGGTWQHSNSNSATDNVQVTNSSWTNTLSASPITIGATVAKTSGTRSFTGNCFDKTVAFAGVKDFAFSGNLFYLGWTTTFGDWGSFGTNLVRTTTSQGGVTLDGDSTNNYLISEPVSTDSNPHYLNCASGTASTRTHTQWIAEYTGSDFNGDIFLHINGAITYNITYCITLPNAATTRNNSGTLITMGADIAGQTINVEHNTGFTGGQSLVQYSEGSPVNHAGMIGSFKSNIAWCDAVSYSSSLGPYKLCKSFPPTSTDVVDPANATNNCGYNQLTGSPGNGYNGDFSSTPGATDINVNPQFFDDTRKLATWAAYHGSTGTAAQKVADALAKLAKRNDASGYDSNYSISGTPTSLIEWVRAGFAPQNAALHNTGHDGTDVGAVAYQSVPGPFPHFMGGLQGGFRDLMGGTRG